MLARALLRLLALAVASHTAWAQPYTASRIDRPDAQGIIWSKAPSEVPSGVIVVVPGAQMTADRYTWLSEAAVARGYAAVIVEPALEWLTFPAGSSNLVPARYVTLPHALAALDYARAKWPGARKNIVAVGHSLGAAIVLELLDPQEAKRNPNNRSPSDFAGVDDLAAAIIIGTSLQAKGGSFELPYRSEDRSLHSPASTRLLFIAGENDGMATPQLMGKTAARYARPPRLEVVPGANHLNWSYGRGPMDRPDLDRPATISADQQIARTLDIMWEFLSH